MFYARVLVRLVSRHSWKSQFDNRPKMTSATKANGFLIMLENIFHFLFLYVLCFVNKNLSRKYSYLDIYNSFKDLYHDLIQNNEYLSMIRSFYSDFGHLPNSCWQWPFASFRNSSLSSSIGESSNIDFFVYQLQKRRTLQLLWTLFKLFSIAEWKSEKC